MTDPAPAAAPVPGGAPPASAAQLLLYRVVRNFLVGFAKLFWRMQVIGLEKVPATGSFVVAPVHRSNIDFALVSGLSTRRIRYMGKDTVFKYQRINWFFDALGGFPVKRGTADREALRRCAEIIRSGEPLVIFPEGARQTGPDVQPLFEGAAYLATKAGVPIVPVGIGGSEAAMPKGSKFVRKARVVLVVGDPIHPPAPDGGASRSSRKVVHALTERLHHELQALFDDAQRRAGHRTG